MGLREGQRTTKRIGDGDGKPWIVERRPLGSALSQSITATVCRRDAGYHRFWLTDPAYIRNSTKYTEGTPRYRGDNERIRETPIDQTA